MIIQLFNRPVKPRPPSETAVEWLLRHDMGDMSREEQQDFAVWMNDSGNAAAYERVQRRWECLDRVRDTDLAMLLRRPALRLRPERRMRWAAGGAGLAACAALVLIAIPLGLNPAAWVFGPRPNPAEIGAADYETQTGDRDVVTLPDGTKVTLNTETAIDVAYSEGQRLVRLLHGQAFFDVARDEDWPFVVQAADRRVVALGTAFDVRLSQEKFQVVLVEGSVRIDRSTSVRLLTPPERAAPPAPPMAPAAATERFLVPGEQLLAELGVPETIQIVNVERELRWRDGFVEFDDERLEAAIAEMNRYTRRPVIIRDAGVGDLRVSGVFRTSQVDRFLSTISEILPVTVDYTAADHLQLRWSRDAARG